MKTILANEDFCIWYDDVLYLIDEEIVMKHEDMFWNNEKFLKSIEKMWRRNYSKSKSRDIIQRFVKIYVK